MPIRVLIVDDHPVTRRGMVAALAGFEEVDVVGEAATAEEAFLAVEKLDPNVVFMDVRMPGIDGIEATKAIRRSNPETKVILFTMDESRTTVTQAMQAGISGYLLKDASPDELVHAARLAVEGRAFVHPALTPILLEEVRFGDVKPPSRLSAREKQVLRLMADGSTTKRIAHELGISPHTVRTHLERIYDKLGANDKAQAVATAIRLQLLD